MKTIKPLKLSLLTRCWEHDRKSFLSVAIMALFSLAQPEHLFSEQALWQFLPDELGSDVLIDEGMPKQNGEVLVWGACFCPNQRPRLACPVTLELGGIKKTLHVFGDRFWEKKGPLTRVTDPKPFTRMSLRYDNAFGGRDYPLNPKGKGLAPVLTPDGAVIHPLPNIERPDRLIGSPEDRPEPAGFGPLDLTWPQRFDKVGTFDKKWFEERFPGFAKDMDWNMFNTAPPDQWNAGFFKGDEPLTLENMHPEKQVLHSRLPGMAARCFINQALNGIEEFKEIPTRLDTVWLFPQAEKGVVIFRAVTETAEDDAEDVRHIMIAAEALTDPRSLEYYREEFEKRIDKDKGYLYALRDLELLPPEPERAEGIEEPGESEDGPAPAKLLWENLNHRTEKELEAARNTLREKGLDPLLYLPEKLPEEEEPDLDNLDILVREAEEQAEKTRQEGELRLAAAEKELRATLTRQGLDYDEVMAEAKKMAGGRPKFKASEARAQFKSYQDQMKTLGVINPEFDRMLADPDLDEKLLDVEKTLEDSYQKYAHHFLPAVLPEPEEARRMGLEVQKEFFAGQTFEGRDFSGVDLSGMDLKGVVFKNAFLEGANLSGADLSRADLTGAVLVRAKASGVNLGGAKLEEANLAQADLSLAKLDGGADLTRAVLAEADLSGADLSDARLDEADLFDAKLQGTNLTRAFLPKAHFMETDLSGVCFRGADLSQGVFINVGLDEADFRESILTSATFLRVTADGASFQKADLENFRAVDETSMAGADFSQAVLTGANLRGVNLGQAQFTEAVLEGADLSSANLQNANFYRARAKGGRFIRADLEGASMIGANLWDGNFQKTRLQGTRFTGANLFGANFLKARADSKTDWTDALLTRAIFKGQGAKS